MFVCPLPPLWNEIYGRLHHAWLKGGAAGPPPPVPLILSGWVYSNDLDKKIRWEDTVAWARAWGFDNLIPEIEESRSYMVAALTTYEVGPMGGPMYLKWDYSPKPTPSAKDVESALNLLTTDWAEIAGPQLAPHTRPLGLTGKKRRRLLVWADREFSPPWGSWNKLDPGDKRRDFTRLRKDVNERIKPLVVDHIEFVLTE